MCKAGAPQKSPPFLLRPSALCPTSATPHPRPLSRKRRGVKDLGQSAATLRCIPPRRALCPRPTFLAPQKSQKTPFWQARNPSPPNPSPARGEGGRKKSEPAAAEDAVDQPDAQKTRQPKDWDAEPERGVA